MLRGELGDLFRIARPIRMDLDDLASNHLADGVVAAISQVQCGKRESKGTVEPFCIFGLDLVFPNHLVDRH